MRPGDQHTCGHDRSDPGELEQLRCVLCDELGDGRVIAGDLAVQGPNALSESDRLVAANPRVGVFDARAPSGDRGNLRGAERRTRIDAEIDRAHQCSQRVNRPGPRPSHLVAGDDEDPRCDSRPIARERSRNAQVRDGEPEHRPSVCTASSSSLLPLPRRSPAGIRAASTTVRPSAISRSVTIAPNDHLPSITIKVRASPQRQTSQPFALSSPAGLVGKMAHGTRRASHDCKGVGCGVGIHADDKVAFF